MGLLGGIFSAVGSIIGGKSAAKSAEKAAAAQVEAARIATDEQRRQYDTTRQDNSPWLSAGGAALNGQMDLLGMGDGIDWGAYVKSDPWALQDWTQKWSGGPNSLGNMSIEDYGKFNYGHDLAYKRGEVGGYEGADPNYAGRDLSQFKSGDPIAKLKEGPLYQSLYANGEEALLANASATGGLRGGNTQRGLADFGRDTLAQVIENQFQKLGGLSGAGQQSGQFLGQMGQQSANNISSLAVGAGNARAGSYLAQGAASNNMWNQIGSTVGGLDFGSILNGGKIKL